MPAGRPSHRPHEFALRGERFGYCPPHTHVSSVACALGRSAGPPVVATGRSTRMPGFDVTPPDRLRYVLDRLSANGGEPGISMGDALCATTVEVLEVDGAGLSLHGPSGAPYSVGLAGEDMAVIHDLERDLGEGPCIDAFRTGNPSAAPDLAEPAVDRWPAFRTEVLRTSARAAFGYPLRVATDCVGALNLYTMRTGSLDEQQHRDALLLAELSTHAVLASLSLDPPGGAATEMEDVVRNQDEVHQATGMISVQTSLSIVDSLARLRARAYAEGRSISEVAKDVVERRVRFEP